MGIVYSSTWNIKTSGGRKIAGCSMVWITGSFQSPFYNSVASKWCAAHLVLLTSLLWIKLLLPLRNWIWTDLFSVGAILCKLCVGKNLTKRSIFKQLSSDLYPNSIRAFRNNWNESKTITGTKKRRRFCFWKYVKKIVWPTYHQRFL